MDSTRPLPPIWLMGMGFFPLGASGSIMLITVPQLLAANHVPEQQIASVTAIALIPGFGCFLLGPLLDWKFSRRAYAVGFTILAALCNFAALLAIHNLAWLTAFLFVSSTAIGLCVSAVGGWFGNITRTEDKGTLGAWFTVGNLGAGGLVATAGIDLLRGLPYTLGAGLLSLSLLLALPLYFRVDCPPADARLASESFRDFARDVLALLRRHTVLLTLLLFVMPAASFALTNSLSGLGADFHTPEKMVALVGGIGVSVAAVIGSLLIPQVNKWIPPRALYLCVGGFGALFSLTLTLLAHNPVTFGLALMGENFFQGAAFAVGNVIVLRTIGHDNPLAATQFGLLNAASMLPLIYMQFLDGQAYGLGGVNGSYLSDALVSGSACLLLGLGFWLLRRKLPAD